MPEAETAADGDEAVWEQGDYALGVGGHLFADVPPPDNSEHPYDPREDDSSVVGLIVVSQTCDIVNSGGGEHVAVCPLVECDKAALAELRKGRRPSFVQIEHPPAEHVFADLSRVMSVSKKLLLTWDRQPGFSTLRARRRFAFALERKFGRFAFPSDIVTALKALRDRIVSKHDKPESPLGKIYRSLEDIRVRCAPDWNAAERKIGLVCVLRSEEYRVATDDEIFDELRVQCDNIKWPDGCIWDPDRERCLIGNSTEISAADLYESQAIDLQYLST